MDLAPPRASESRDRLPPAAGEPLVPILRLDEGLGDPVALATWHEALSNALSVDVAHDLLGLWLYPAEGGTALLGPAALAADDLAVPLPSPQVEPSQLALLEEIVRDAGYGSVAALPVRFGKRDVALLLIADLRPERYANTELVTLRRVAQRLAPSLGRLARLWGSAHNSATYHLERVSSLLEIVAQANAQAATPQLYLAALSRALEPLLPHDHLELLLADDTGARFFRLGEHAGGALWADPSLIIGRGDLDLNGLFGGHDQMLLADAFRDQRWPRGYFTAADPPGAELRAAVGARLQGPHGPRSYLLVGSIGPDLYDEEDAALLGRVAGLIRPQVALWSKPAGGEPSEPRPVVPLEIVEVLATTADPAEATRRVAELAAEFLPFDQMRYAIRLSEGDRVVLLEPGERRPMPDLPSVPVAGTALEQVLQGVRPHLFALVQGEARLIVPLRVAGRIPGALVFTAAHPALLREVHAEPALRLADAIAPHLELLRRAALLPPPYLPGWKRAPKG